MIQIHFALTNVSRAQKLGVSNTKVWSLILVTILGENRVTIVKYKN